jgi:epoxyqueuosine reductase QueG
MFEQNNRSWAESDLVIYRSWRVDAMHDLHPSALWPRELEAIVVRVAIVKEVVADVDETM